MITRSRAGAAPAALALSVSIALGLTVAAPAYSATAESPDPRIAVSGRIVISEVQTAASRLVPDGSLSPAQFSRAYSLWVPGERPVPIAGDQLAGIQSGASFEGVLTIPEDVAAAVVADDHDALADAGTAPVTADSPAGHEVLAYGSAADDPFTVAEGHVIAVQPTASAAIAHTVYVTVMAQPGGSADFITDSQINTLISSANSFYADQTRGNVPSITRVGTIVRDTPDYDPANSTYHPCDPNWDWYNAIENAGMDPESTNPNAAPFDNQGKHVLLIYPSACADTALGTGTLGTQNRGGLLQISVGIGLDKSTLAHELGHNFGLLHSNLHHCESADDEGVAPDCGVLEYGDPVDIMGGGVIGPGGQTWDVLSALNVNNRVAEGWGAPGATEAWSLGGGASPQTRDFAVQAATAASGLQQLTLTDPQSGRAYLVEFRSGAGRDAGSLYTTGLSSQLGPGIRILTAYTQQVQTFTEVGTVVYEQTPDDAAPLDKAQYVAAGQSWSARDAGVTVAVLGISGDTATVRVTLSSIPQLAPKYGNPVVSGGLTVGSAWSLTRNNWNVPLLTKSHQWLRDGLPIGGATGPGYTVAAADIGHMLSLQVSGNRSGYYAGSAQSTPVCVTTQPFSFADVCTAATFFDAIEWMKATGLSTGTPQSTGKPLYKPADAVSRQAMAAFLYRYAGDTFVPPADPTFADVPTGNPFFTQIEWMAAEGISTGTPQPEGKPLFNPANPVSRQSMALFLARFAGATLTTPTEQSFADVPVDAASAAAIEWMKTAGISTGTPQPSGLPLFKPVDPVSRQAMAAFLQRLDGYLH